MKRLETEIEVLEKAGEKITAVARSLGLDFFPTYFELCSADIIHTVSAYGMPVRFSHWIFGKYFYRFKTMYNYNLQRIYELVINSNPCYAFLLAGNSLVENMTVMAHALAHSDFFKNNAAFACTNRSMPEVMARHAERIRDYARKYGQEAVEKFLDAVLALREQIEPPLCASGKQKERGERRKKRGDEKDLLLFLARESPVLTDWERDVILMVREEMLYFWPQLETKIMNEGWATYWHIRIMREMDLTDAETIEFARFNAEILQGQPFSLNPYLLGLKIWENIEKRWEAEGENGREKMFLVRETEKDLSFVRNYFTPEVAEELDLYAFRRSYTRWQVAEKDWCRLRDILLQQLTNCGFPYIVVRDGNYRRAGELYLYHWHDGRDLDLYHLERTLPYLFRLWGRPVHLETVVEGKKMCYTFDGEKVLRQNLS